MKPLLGIETFRADHGFVLGHQGGWDEILLVAGPLLVVGLLLWLANKRVTAQLEESQGADVPPPASNDQQSR